MSETKNLGELIIADDDAAIRDMLGKALRADFTVYLAKDGIEAKALVDSRRPAALLIDEMMPGARGTEVLAYAAEKHPHALRLLMTASTDFDAAVRAINEGHIHRFFGKPLRPVELKRGLKEIVENARAEELLKVELDALHALHGARVVEISALVIGEDALIVDEVVAACAARGLRVRQEQRPELSPSTMMQRSDDLVVLVRGPTLNWVELARIARTIDEGVALVLIDPSPELERALAAFHHGLSDYMPLPLPPRELLARRLERAALAHVSARDTKRLTSELVLLNRQLVEARRKTEEDQLRVLDAMIRTLEARDSYTAGHTDRVASIAVRLAETLGHDPELVERIRVGALLHDIGKIGVRDDVLLKPGRLTPDEFQVIKTHTTVGAGLLDGVSQFTCVLSMIRHHHEKMDGTGYPDGLKGTSIPIEARVVAVADVMDAITSTRPYRSRSGLDEAFTIMESLRGHHLDPEILDALHALHRDGRLLPLLQVTVEG